MFEELEQYLLSVVSPERTQLLIEACEVINLAGISGVASEVERLLEQVENYALEQWLGELEGLLVTMVEGCLNQFGCFLSDEAELKHATAAVRGLLTLSNYDAPEAIEGICTGDQPPEEALAELLELVTEYTLEDYLITFERVSGSLLTRVVETLTVSVESSLEAVDANSKLRTVQWLQQFPTLLIGEAIQEGYRLGSPIDVLLTPYVDYIQPLPPERAAIELVGFVFASNTPDSELLPTALAKLEDIYTDVNQITKTAVALKRVMNEALGK